MSDSLLDDPDFPHTDVQVETLIGNDARGPVFAPAVTRSVIVEQGRQLVRDDKGDQVVSETTLFDRVDQVSLYLVGSRVTVGDRAARVISAKTRQLDADVDHLEISLT